MKIQIRKILEFIIAIISLWALAYALDIAFPQWDKPNSFSVPQRAGILLTTYFVIIYGWVTYIANRIKP